MLFLAKKSVTEMHDTGPLKGTYAKVTFCIFLYFHVGLYHAYKQSKQEKNTLPFPVNQLKAVWTARLL